MSNQLLFLKKKLQGISLLMLFGGAFLCSSFIDPPVKKSGHLPLYKMTPTQVNSIIQGLPLDKRVIFEFIIDGSTDKPVDVSWYKASGMNDHAKGESPTLLEKIPSTLAINFYQNSTYVLANNYIFVKDFKTYVRSLPSQNFEYLLFTAEQKADTRHIYFKIRAHYTEEETKAKKIDPAFFEDFQTQPSPPANAGGN